MRYYISLKKLKNKSVLIIKDNNKTIRKIDLIKGEIYIINPLNKRQKGRGRFVILKDYESTNRGVFAKVKYLDSLRAGKVEIENLDTIDSNFVFNSVNKLKTDEVNNHFISEKLVHLFQIYLDILNVIDDKKDRSNIAYISQKEIATKISKSPTNVSKKIKELIKYGALEQLSPGAYKLLFNDIWHTPYKIVHRVMLLVSEQPSLIKSYKQQAELLNVPLDDIFQAWSYIRLIKE